MRNVVSPTAEPGTATRPMDTDTIYGRPGMGTAVATPEEWALVAHVRGHCHDSTACALCAAQADTFRWRTHHRSEELRRIDTEINNAFLARAVQAMEERAIQAEHTLASIIEG